MVLNMSHLYNRNMGKPHVLILPYPVPGHVIPLLELAQVLSEHDFKITLVTTSSSHDQLIETLPNKNILCENFRIVSIPDNGLEKNKFEELIVKIKESEEDYISCVVADQSLGWAMEVGEKMNIKRVAFLPAAAATLVLGFSIPKLIKDGVIRNDGTIAKEQAIQLSTLMPIMKTTDFVWTRIGNLATQKSIFGLMARNNKSIKSANYLICNSTHSLEPGAFSLFPNILPIGPLLASNRLGNLEDMSSLEWLDHRAKKSVIYVAFGSHTIFSQTQFQELALGLELTNRPFLWVVRENITEKMKIMYPERFLERVASRGKIVDWTRQPKVLSHDSIACFVTHCGWNSTIEGLSNGVPFLCWPNSADQFINKTYICDIWKVGLNFEKDEKGIVTKEEIRNNAGRLLDDVAFKSRAMDLKDGMSSSIGEDGSSFKNFKKLVEWMKV